MTAQRMVEEQIVARGVRDQRVIDAMRRVPRAVFVPEAWQDRAHEDRALPIGCRQTISQPYIVARMSELLAVEPTHSVLEIGTGSGYQTAVLAELARTVCSIEVLPQLSRIASDRIEMLGYRNVTARVGDGHSGWGTEQSFDRVIVTAAPDVVPPVLVDQLVMGGRLVLPLGEENQVLVVIDRTPNGTVKREVMPVRFVPMTHDTSGDDHGGEQ